MQPVTDKSGSEVTGHLMFKRQFELDLIDGVGPIKSFPGVPSTLSKGKKRKREIDLIILSEGTGRVAKYCFDLALGRNGRLADDKKLVTCTHHSFRTH